MSGANVDEFIAYWEKEGESYVRRGDYDWMAGLVAGRRVLEIGCGVGYATQALLARGCTVLAIDTLPACLAATAGRVGDTDRLELLEADIARIDDAQFARLAAFAPEVVVCWLMGAPADTTGARATDAGQAVAAYREQVQRQVAELAAALPGVTALHIVDRTAIPWQAKDIGRDTLVRYHQFKTLIDLPWVAERRHALYRKLEDNALELARLRQAHPALKGVVPVLASLFVERKK